MKVEIFKDDPVFNDTGFLCFSSDWIKGFGFSTDVRIWTFGFGFSDLDFLIFKDTGFLSVRV
jgi:hypothetical protein